VKEQEKKETNRTPFDCCDLSDPMTRFICVNTIFCLFLTNRWSEAFTSIKFGDGHCHPQRSIVLRAIPTPEQSVQAFQDYMSKSHEEKLKAVKQVETQKQTEIEALKKEVEQLKSSQLPIASVPQLVKSTSSESVDEMKAKIKSYQDFMTKYIVNAQEDKFKAIKAAERAVVIKYEDKFALLLGPASQNSKKETSLYESRSANVAAAAKTGKSRWGDAEVKRATELSDKVVSDNVVMKVEVSIPEVDSVENNNGVVRNDLDHVKVTPVTSSEHTNGIALKDSDHGNSIVISDPDSTKKTVESVAYERRNDFIAAAAKAGKQYRWGVREEQRAIERVAAPSIKGSSDKGSMTEIIPEADIPQEVKDADHGLRADGGVGGPSLAERVNLGAELLK